jgi:hypothetical protein
LDEPPEATPPESPPFSPAPPKSSADVEQFAYEPPALGEEVIAKPEDDSGIKESGSVPKSIEVMHLT